MLLKMGAVKFTRSSYGAVNSQPARIATNIKLLRSFGFHNFNLDLRNLAPKEHRVYSIDVIRISIVPEEPSVQTTTTFAFVENGAL